MIEFILNDEPIDFYLDAETEPAPPPSGTILIGSTTVLWGSTTITFQD